MNIINSPLTNNPCYKNNVGRVDSRYCTFQDRGPIGLMLHSVGCAQPSASVFVKNWNKSSFDSACVHGFIDANTGDIYKCLEWNYRGWHAGGSANNTHIGVEMCEPDCIKYIGGAKFTCSNIARAKEMATRTYNAAVELYAYLCKMYNLNPLGSGVIVSHSEGAKMGIAANHADPEHLWTQLGLPYTMDTFRAAVKECIDSGKVPDVPAPTPIEVPNPVLKKGDKGPEVVKLQKALIKAGCSLPKYGADGDYGNETASAVSAFQKKVFETGTYDEKTYNALKAYLNV